VQRHFQLYSLVPRLHMTVTERKACIPKPSAATMTCERKMRCISVARIFIRGITRVGAARMPTAITPARSMTIRVRRIGDVGELTTRLKRA
jgi:hypothetical protein